MTLAQIVLGASVVIAAAYLAGAAAGWNATNPAQAGWGATALADVVAYVRSQRTTGFLIVQDGKVICERNWPLPRHAASFAENFTDGTDAQGALREDVASAQKSFVSILVGIAADKGLLNVSKPVSAYVGPGWSQAPREREKLIAVRNLLEMNSGLTQALAYEAPPGTKFSYNTPAYAIVKQVLQTASRQRLNSLTRAWLTEPLDMTDTFWRRRSGANCEIGNPAGLYTTPRDMAKLAQLVLDGGTAADGKLVISAAQLHAIFHRSPTNPAYGRLWWLNGSAYTLGTAGSRTETALIPAAPADLVAALGAHDRKIYIVPSRKLIVVRTGRATPDLNFDQEVWLRLMKALAHASAT
jgi:CubicO group peptidase (beta-lactamase class C family)